jgi:hypothetical protein
MKAGEQRQQQQQQRVPPPPPPFLNLNLVFVLSNYNFYNFYTAGMCDTAGFVRHRANTGTVCTRTRYGYGVCGYGYGVENPDPRYTRDEP